MPLLSLRSLPYSTRTTRKRNKQKISRQNASNRPDSIKELPEKAVIATLLGVLSLMLVDQSPVNSLAFVNASAAPKAAPAAADVGLALNAADDESTVSAYLAAPLTGIIVPPEPTVPTTVTTIPPTTQKPTTTLPKKPPATTAPKNNSSALQTSGALPKDVSKCSTSRAAMEACWAPLVNQYSWNKQQAFNIIWCESRGNPNAKNPRSTATGLFQILNGPFDPEANVRLAFQMYSKRGWQPWVCRP
jgi:hypothetical protein